MTKARRPIAVNSHTWAQASDWLLRFSEEDVDAQGREQFNAWLRSSPENVHAYLQVSAFWQAAGDMGRQQDGSRDIDALVARAKRENNIFPLALGLHSERRHSAGHKYPVRLWSGLVASILALITVTSYFYLRAPVYQTGIGEQRTINLPDGSTVTLNADSRMEVRFDDTERRIELRDGRALFKVARNAARPFVVRSGSTSVRAVGTQFDVHLKRGETVVTVVEGRVAVSSSLHSASRVAVPSESGHQSVSDVLLSAGERIIVAAVTSDVRRSIEARPDVPSPGVQSVDLAEATAWTEGLLVFEAAPLEEVVQEFNRQNSKPLVLDGEALASVRITGTFPAAGSERITRFLRERHGVVVHETDDEIRISLR